MAAFSDLDILVTLDVEHDLRSAAARARRRAAFWRQLAGHGWRATRHDERARRLEFLLALIEDGGYALLEADCDQAGRELDELLKPLRNSPQLWADLMTDFVPDDFLKGDAS